MIFLMVILLQIISCSIKEFDKFFCWGPHVYNSYFTDEMVKIIRYYCEKHQNNNEFTNNPCGSHYCYDKRFDLAVGYNYIVYYDKSIGSNCYYLFKTTCHSLYEYYYSFLDPYTTPKIPKDKCDENGEIINVKSVEKVCDFCSKYMQEKNGKKKVKVLLGVDPVSWTL